MRCISTHWKAFGLCCLPGYGLTEAFRKRNDRGIWASLNSFTMFVVVARLCFIPCWQFS
jgi:hypothetical protein